MVKVIELKIEDISKAWAISDTHFLHDNIIRFCDRPLDHEKIMLDNWKRLVNEDDLVIHLGDILYHRKKRIDPKRWYSMVDEIKTLPGNKYLVKGNHDVYSTKFYTELGFKVITKYQICNEILFIHNPQDSIEMWDEWNICFSGHFHNSRSDDPLLDLGGRMWYNFGVELNDYEPKRLEPILDRFN